jgi:predicted transcriptional regulator
MSSPLVTVNSSSRIRDAADVMWTMKIGSLIVVDDTGHLVGIITERDILYAAAKGLFDVSRGDAKVDSIMAKNVVIINEDASINQATELMSDFNIKHLVVMGPEGKPVGVVSLRDILDVGYQLLRILNPPD